MQTIHLRPSSGPTSDDDGLPEGDTWVDIDASDDEGRRWLAAESGLDAEIVERLLEPPPVNRWRHFSQGLHSHISTPVPDRDHAAIGSIDLGLWVEPGRIITVRQGLVPALDRAAAACARGAGPPGCWGLIVYMLSEGLSRLEHILYDLTGTIDALEDEVLSGENELPIERLGELERRLMFARRFRGPLANLVSFISSQPRSTIDDSLRDELEALGSIFAQNQQLLDLSIERAAALQGQIRDKLADSLNTATYRFTWVATVFLPLGFLTGLLGINVAGIPGDHNPVAFWLVCGVLLVVAAGWGIFVGRVTRPFQRRGGSRKR